MTTSAPPVVECDQVHPVLVVSDIAAAIECGIGIDALDIETRQGYADPTICMGNRREVAGGNCDGGGISPASQERQQAAFIVAAIDPLEALGVAIELM